jgi:folylpolyglutamate synthase/dihydropteroate synthase
MINILAGTADKFICTEPSHPDALPADELAVLAESTGRGSLSVKDYKEAVVRAENEAGEEGIVAAAGSLYLIADIRRLFNDRF